MAARDSYRAQIELLIRCLPAIASAPHFALRGGTAINLFLRDMPRLSVDIDLAYLPLPDRGTALDDTRAQFATIAERLKRTVPGANVQLVEGEAPKLLVDKSVARIRVEPSVVIRGSLVPPVWCERGMAAQQAYEPFVEIQRQDLPDLYAGKLFAARRVRADMADVSETRRARAALEAGVPRGEYGTGKNGDPGGQQLLPIGYSTLSIRCWLDNYEGRECLARG
jgi:hypothetical protein